MLRSTGDCMLVGAMKSWKRLKRWVPTPLPAMSSHSSRVGSMLYQSLSDMPRSMASSIFWRTNGSAMARWITGSRLWRPVSTRGNTSCGTSGVAPS